MYLYIPLAHMAMGDRDLLGLPEPRERRPAATARPARTRHVAAAARRAVHKLNGRAAPATPAASSA